MKPLISKQHFLSSTESGSSWAVAKRWFSDCATEHRLCAQKRNEFLPTRLIDISTHTDILPRLLETSEIVSGIKYATLSHCWGKHMPKRLQQDNLLSMKTKIVFSELSKTFKDAMRITKYLGLRYIWIDSLCIIQDSKEDWQREASLMSKVYTNSACNISATGASDGSIGLFFDRNPLAIQPFRARFLGNQAKGSFYLVNPSLWADEVDYSPLNRRAWVVQERLLSPCNLHFGSTQVYWECRQRLACEAYPVALPSAFELLDCYRLDPEGGGARIRESHGLHPDSSLDNYTLWGYIVATYTKGELSFESDKLVAISGIAEQMHKVLGDQYLAGLWRNHLADQLLWVAEYGRERTRKSKRSHEYLAPTWSWASIDGEISRLGYISYTDDRGIMIDILTVRVDLATASPFGQITGAFLQVRGKLAKAVMYVSTEPGGVWSLGVHCKTLCKADFHIFQDVALEEGTEISADLFDNLYCLPIRNPAVYPAGDFGIRGLLLQATGKRNGEFRRFGVFSVFYQKDDVLLTNACEYFDSQAESCGLEYSSDDNGGYKYIITIV
jgi:Heterokaryon incompatibility protein (HET)